MTTLGIHFLNAKYRVKSMGRASAPRVFVNSIPKTGTNLVVSLALAYRRIAISGPIIAPVTSPRDFDHRKGLMFGHVESLEGTIDSLGLDDGFLMVRRPEDYVMSLARYIQANPRHPAHHALAKSDPSRLIHAVVQGIDLQGFKLKSIDARYRQYFNTAKRAGLKIVDFDDLKACPESGGPAADLMRVIGGEDYAAHFDEMLSASKETSTTYRHSGKSHIQGKLPDSVKHHPAFQGAAGLYECSVFN
jgi:hypothetical protein